MKKIKISIIGATGTAYKRIIPALQNSEICVVTSIQGRNFGEISRIGEQFNIGHLYTDIHEMFQQKNFDCIYIATPPFLHLENILESITTGKPILCEKPLARNYAEGLKIGELLDSSGNRQFQIAHHLRHQQAINDIKKWIDRKIIGKPLNVFAQWGYEMDLHSKNAGWKTDPDLQGLGTLSDNGIHLVDLIIHLFGLPNRIGGRTDKIRTTNTFDNEIALLHYDDTCVYLHSSQSLKHPGNHLLIHGSHGKIEVYHGIGEQSISQIILETDQGVETINYPPTNLYRNEVEEFCKSMMHPSSENRGTTFEEGLAALKIIDQAREAAVSGKTIEFEAHI